MEYNFLYIITGVLGQDTNGVKVVKRRKTDLNQLEELIKIISLKERNPAIVVMADWNSPIIDKETYESLKTLGEIGKGMTSRKKYT